METTELRPRLRHDSPAPSQSSATQQQQAVTQPVEDKEKRGFVGTDKLLYVSIGLIVVTALIIIVWYVSGNWWYSQTPAPHNPSQRQHGTGTPRQKSDSLKHADVVNNASNDDLARYAALADTPTPAPAAAQTPAPASTPAVAAAAPAQAPASSPSQAPQGEFSPIVQLTSEGTPAPLTTYSSLSQLVADGFVYDSVVAACKSPGLVYSGFRWKYQN